MAKKRSTRAKPLPRDLARYRDTYVELFGVLPPLPGARIAFSGDVAPDYSRLMEKLRAHALSPIGDLSVKHIQLICFGMLVVEGHDAAYWHAVAARRLGASWAELHKMVELAGAITSGLGALNRGGALLQRLRTEESDKQGQ